MSTTLRVIRASLFALLTCWVVVAVAWLGGRRDFLAGPTELLVLAMIGGAAFAFSWGMSGRAP